MTFSSRERPSPADRGSAPAATDAEAAVLPPTLLRLPDLDPDPAGDRDPVPAGDGGRRAGETPPATAAGHPLQAEHPNTDREVVTTAISLTPPEGEASAQPTDPPAKPASDPVAATETTSPDHLLEGRSAEAGAAAPPHSPRGEAPKPQSNRPTSEPAAAPWPAEPPPSVTTTAAPWSRPQEDPSGKATAWSSLRRRVSSSDSTPEGRSWMERIGSQTLVLAILLAVTAAAILAGRRGEPAPDSPDPQLPALGTVADSHPMATPELDVHPTAEPKDELAAAARSPEPGVSGQANLAESYAAAPTTPASNSTVPLVGPHTAAAGLPENETVPETSSSKLAGPPLDAPSAEEPPSDGGTEFSEPNPQSAMAFPQTASASPDPVALHPADNAAATPEESAESSEPAEHGVSTAAAPPAGPRQTATPNPIRDWSWYLPPPPSEVVADSSAAGGTAVSPQPGRSGQGLPNQSVPMTSAAPTTPTQQR